MNAVVTKLAPSATTMIRMDHTKVLAVFHKYETDAAPKTKQALVNTICLSLEIHAQLEEEIFYPAVRAVEPGVVDKNVHEHETMRRLISALRNMEPTHPNYDNTLFELMREVIHHVADEETVLLPAAERLLGNQLSELGAQMMKRKLQLMRPRAGELVRNSARAMPTGAMIGGAGALIVGGYLIRHLLQRQSTTSVT